MFADGCGAHGCHPGLHWFLSAIGVAAFLHRVAFLCDTGLAYECCEYR